MANSKRKCAYCKSYKKVESGIVINNRFYCSYEHATLYGKKMQYKGKVKREKEIRKDLRERKESTRPKSYYADKAQDAVNRYIRARDRHKPCISCGTMNNVQYAAGHFKTKGAYPELRFNLFNIHKQCNQYCNMRLSGNINGNKTSHGYMRGLKMRYGNWIVEYLEKKHQPKNYTVEDLKRIARIFNKRARFYEKMV